MRVLCGCSLCRTEACRPCGRPSRGTGTRIVTVALLAGKPIGIAAVTLAGCRLGLYLPSGVTWRDVIVVGCVAGIGFTVALFFCTATSPLEIYLTRRGWARFSASRPRSSRPPRRWRCGLAALGADSGDRQLRPRGQHLFRSQRAPMAADRLSLVLGRRRPIEFKDVNPADDPRNGKSAMR